MKVYYFEKGWILNPKIAKKALSEKRNKKKDFDLSESGQAHQIDEYYLKKDVDKLLKKNPFYKIWNNKKEDKAWKHL